MNASTQQDIGKLVLRIALGLLILLHGIFKLRHGIGGIEGMVAAHGLPGFVARVGAALVAVNMLFAFALAHMGHLARLNEQGGWALELQGMYLAAAVALALLGPGRYAINQR